MLYLVLSADPFGIPLRKEGSPPQIRWPVALSEDLERAVLDWNERISDIIATSDRFTKEDLAELISCLNEEGAQVADMLNHALSQCAKVKYLPEKPIIGL